MDKYITKNIIKVYAIDNSLFKPKIEIKCINETSLDPRSEIEIGIKEISINEDIIDKVVILENDKDIDLAIRNIS